MEQVIEERSDVVGGRDIALVAAARNGDREAFEALLGRHLDGTFRTVLAIVGNEPDARDATQEIFITVWRELPRLREADRFGAWLGRITVNTCRKSLRSRGRRRLREIPVLDHGTPEVASDAGRRPDFTLAAADADALDRAFGRLPVETRMLLVLHYFDEEPLAEIGNVLGIPVGTVKSRLSAARQALARALEVELR